MPPSAWPCHWPRMTQLKPADAMSIAAAFMACVCVLSGLGMSKVPWQYRTVRPGERQGDRGLDSLARGLGAPRRKRALRHHRASPCPPLSGFRPGRRRHARPGHLPFWRDEDTKHLLASSFEARGVRAPQGAKLIDKEGDRRSPDSPRLRRRPATPTFRPPRPPYGGLVAYTCACILAGSQRRPGEPPCAPVSACSTASEVAP